MRERESTAQTERGGREGEGGSLGGERRTAKALSASVLASTFVKFVIPRARVTEAPLPLARSGSQRFTFHVTIFPYFALERNTVQEL